MRQEDMLKASVLEKKYRQLESNLQLVETQIPELEKFASDLDFLIESKNKDSLSLLGKGVFMETSIKDKKKLFVEVGADVIVKKTPEQTKKILEGQIKRLKEARLQIIAQIEIHQNQLQNLISSLNKEE